MTGDPSQPANPRTALLSEGLRLYNSGEFESACIVFETLVSKQPNDVDALVGLGMSKWRLRATSKASELFERALAIDSKHESALRGMGLVLLGAGDLARAHSVMSTCASVAPHNSQVWLTLGLVEQRLGRIRDAEICFLTALLRNSSYPEALNNLATVYLQQRRYSEARELAMKAIDLKPSLSESYRTLAKTLREVGDDREALETLKRCISINPHDPYAWHDLGCVYRDMSDVTSSINAYEKALSIDPTLLDTKGNLSCILATDGDYERARQLCSEITTQKPEAFGIHVRKATILPAIMMSNQQIEDSRRFMLDSLTNLESADGHITDPLAEVSSTNFYLAYHGRNEKVTQEKTANIFLKHTPVLSFIAPHIGKTRKPGRIRLGICSKHLTVYSNGPHTIATLWADLFARLNRDKFELFLFHTLPSYNLTPASLRQRIDHAHRLPAHVAGAQQMVAEQQLDILFFPDIGMEPQSYFLSFARLAPTQVVTWGHPLTTGVPCIDYFISSKELEVDGAESHYSERLVKLKNLNTYYIRPSCRDLISKETLNIKQNETLYVCPQNLFKLHPDFDSVIERILDGNPSSKVILIEGNCARHTTLIQERMRLTIPKVLDRIQFIPRLNHEQFLSLLKTADVMLDPLHFGGGSTTLQALSFGTPVVTLPSEFLRGRISYACYRHMEYEDLVARCVDEYCDIAIKLSRNADERNDLRRNLAAKSGVLFSNHDVITEYEEFLERVFHGQAA